LRRRPVNAKESGECNAPNDKIIYVATHTTAEEAEENRDKQKWRKRMRNVFFTALFYGEDIDSLGPDGKPRKFSWLWLLFVYLTIAMFLSLLFGITCVAGKYLWLLWNVGTTDEIMDMLKKFVSVVALVLCGMGFGRWR
jgi:hypothetical protein